MLDLQNNGYHKALWALWLTQWQGLLRSSDLIKKKREAQVPWDPRIETHRGRLSMEVAKDLQNRILGPRIKLLLKPNKTDQAGTENTVKTFIVDAKPGSLSAGQAIREMIKADPLDNGLENTPLFRNPGTDKEITYDESHATLQMCLKQAGYGEHPAGTHSLRIGGATAYANARSGGYAVSGFMGLWASPSRDGYIHACAPRIDMAALEIGRGTDWELAGRPGPVNRYAQ